MPTRRNPPKLLASAVAYYSSTKDGTYRMVARVFRVGEATVSRTLRRYRETGSVEMPEPVYAPKNKIDLDWLRARIMALTDARLREYAASVAKERGIAVSISCVHNCMEAIGFTHMKKRLSQGKGMPSNC